MNKVSGNPLKNRVKARLRAGGQSVSNQTALMVVTALFVSSYLISNTMAVKVIGLFNIFFFDAGTIVFPFAYMLGDVLTELWGFRIAKRVIWTTFFCNILMVVCTQIGVWLPAPEHMEEISNAYGTIFNCVPRIVLASLVGFLCGELSNAWLMVKIREKTKGKHLWVRTIGSSAVGYLFDSLPFVLIAFAGVVPVRELLLMMAFQYVSKLLIEALFGTPLAYAAIKFVRKYVRLDYNN
ncbi:MAG: VUT family protein [Bacteroidales bacterium]|nr:VUT family protein [Bacteroidales bacterium]